MGIQNGISEESVHMNRLEIRFKLDPFLTLEKNLVHQKNGKLLIDVDGELKIMLDELCFFYEPSLTLLELGVSLKMWRTRDPGAAKNFDYFTMEHDEREGPILAFVKKSETEWHLFSIWQEFKQEDTISQDVLLEAVDQYLVDLEEVLIKKFRIRYSDFAKF